MESPQSYTAFASALTAYRSPVASQLSEQLNECPFTLCSRKMPDDDDDWLNLLSDISSSSKVQEPTGETSDMDVDEVLGEKPQISTALNSCDGTGAEPPQRKMQRQDRTPRRAADSGQRKRRHRDLLNTIPIYDRVLTFQLCDKCASNLRRKPVRIYPDGSSSFLVYCCRACTKLLFE